MCDEHSDNECIREAMQLAAFWRRRYLGARRGMAAMIRRRLFPFKRCPEHRDQPVEGCPRCEQSKVAGTVEELR